MSINFRKLAIPAIFAAVLSIGNPGLDDFATYGQKQIETTPGFIGFLAGLMPGVTRAYVVSHSQRHNYWLFSVYRLDPDSSNSPTFLGILWGFYSLGHLLATPPPQPVADQSPKHSADAAALPEPLLPRYTVRSLGQATVTADGVDFHFPLTLVTRADTPLPSAPRIRFTYGRPLPASAQDQYQLYMLRDAVLLVPNGWFVKSAGFGDNGSLGITMHGPEGVLKLSSDGYCVGCAISDIGADFPGKEEWSREQGFPSNYGSHIVPANAHMVQLGTDTLAASWDNGRMNALIYGPTSCPQYVSAVISLPPEQHETARTVLNFFHWITLPTLSHTCTASTTKASN